MHILEAFLAGAVLAGVAGFVLHNRIVAKLKAAAGSVAAKV
jgi:hypothetical protein